MTTTILLSPTTARSLLAEQLEKLDARVIAWPELRINSAADYFALDEAIDHLFGYDWLVLKNEAAAEFFLRRFELRHGADELDDLKILAIGEDTQQALGQTQVHLDLLADRSADVFRALESYSGEVRGLNLLVPSANISRESFELELENAGARADSVLAYQTCAEPDELVKLKALITGGGVDYIAFTHPGAVNEFAAVFDTDDLGRLLPEVGVVCADERTRNAAEALGLSDQLASGNPTFRSLANFLSSVGEPLSNA